jgi:DNA damage-binding protein 1
LSVCNREAKNLTFLHRAGGDVIKSIVFGGLDGIITTFAIVAAVAGASLDIKVIILLGFSNLLADAVSMGLGDYLSSSAELDYQRQERKKEMWEYQNDPEGEKCEMIELYTDKLGFSAEDARKVIDIYTSKPEYAAAFVDHMCTVELEFMPPGEDENPAWDGFVTFSSFIIFGSVPMWLYVIFYVAGYDEPDTDGVRFAVACVVTALTLFALGYVKAFITKMGSALRSGSLMMLNGSLAAASAYLVGWGLEAALDVSQCE